MAALPELILSRAFMMDFAGADAPCFAMGLVEADGQQTGFLAMRPDKPIPREMLGLGLAFGHRVSDFQNELLCQFTFSVYGHAEYSALVNPTSPMVRQVLERMITQQDYFFFILQPDGSASAFRSDLGEENLAGLKDNLPAINAATTPRTTYEAGVAAFRKNPDPAGEVLTWVCWDNPAYMDLDTDPMVLPPA